MEDKQDWKLKLRYGKETTPYQHFTVIGDGTVGELGDGFSCPPGPAFMAMKTWALDAAQSADMLKVIGQQIGFDVTGEITLYETEPTQPPGEHPFGYDIQFTPYAD